MIPVPQTGKSKIENASPRRLIGVVIAVLCIGILASSLYTFIILSNLRINYLSNRGHEIASALDAQVRGPDRRHNLAFWQSVLEANHEMYAGSVDFLGLIDQDGNTLASVGQKPIEPRVPSGSTRDNTFYFDEALQPPRNPRGDASHIGLEWRIRIGIDTASADFIQRLAFLQLFISGLAMAALIVLSIYLARMLNRFLEMKAKEASENQLKLLGVMSASLAHEIRNPLGAMKGLTQLAQEEIPADHAAQTQLRTVVNEAERLEKLVTDLLDFARKKEPQISEFNLADLLADLVKMLQARLEKAQAFLRMSTDPNPFHLRSDPNGLRQVLLNVLINAIDATPIDGTIVLSATRRDDTKTLLIQIDDPGPGLGESASDELFQPFVTTKIRGTGLGLAVSKQIVESLGGSLLLENRPQGGARCSIMIPLL